MTAVDILNLAFALVPLVSEVLKRDSDVTDEALARSMDEKLQLSGLAEVLDGPLLLAVIKFARFWVNR